jgi:hypothetical protein
MGFFPDQGLARRNKRESLLNTLRAAILLISKGESAEFM